MDALSRAPANQRPAVGHSRRAVSHPLTAEQIGRFVRTAIGFPNRSGDVGSLQFAACPRLKTGTLFRTVRSVLGRDLCSAAMSCWTVSPYVRIVSAARHRRWSSSLNKTGGGVLLLWIRFNQRRKF